MLSTPEIEKARGIAVRAHKGQLDKIFAPYIGHPAMVASFVQLLPGFGDADVRTQEAAVCAAWLHDVIEDTSETERTLQKAHIAPEVVVAVVALTRTDDVTSSDYYASIRTNPIAKLVKTADLASNLAPDRVAKLNEESRAWFAAKYAHALGQLGVSRSVIAAIHKAAGIDPARYDTPSRGPVPILIDLHTHSNRSDGTDSPRDLVLNAREVGITHLAITDHDTTAGWAEAEGAAGEVGVHLIRGIELSTKNGDQSQHLLAYEPDPDHPALIELLRRTIVAREARIPLMVERIADHVPRLRLEDVRRIAGDATPSKNHIADALIELDASLERGAVFEKYLVDGCDTYVERWEPSIEDAIATVAAAGGVTVIAHPRGKGGKSKAARFEQLRSCGLSGIEIDHLEHDESDRRELRGIADELGLIVTGSSDYHGWRKRKNLLACETTQPDQFERLESLLAGAGKGPTVRGPSPTAGLAGRGE